MTKDEEQYYRDLEAHFHSSSGSHDDKMQSFPRFVSRQVQSIYLLKWELFKQILDVHGSIVEMGVLMGSGIFSFASFSAILEPYNYQRTVIGFDTFEGFPSISAADLATAGHSSLAKVGGFHVADTQYEQLEEAARLFDRNRPIGHIPKIHLVKGDIKDTIPDYLEKNPQLLISLLYLDLDIYEPTMFALESLYDRVVPGGIIAFDELNTPAWPGESKAYLEFFKGSKGKLKKFTFDPLRSYFVKE